MTRILASLLLVSLLVPGVGFADDALIDPVAEEIMSSEIATTTPKTQLPLATEEYSATTTEPLTQAGETAEAMATETILVKFKDSVDLDTMDGEAMASDTLAIADASITEVLPDANIAVVEAIGDAEVAASLLEDLPMVDYAEPNYERGPAVIATNDSLRDQLWAIENTGQTVGSVAGITDVDIDGQEAWSLSYGTSTIVAVIDSGVLYTHPDLDDNMWDGSACVNDQGGVLGNCLHGYDFVDNDTNPLPVASTTTYEHGTHVAGTIAAERNNGIGSIGVAPGATIMAIRFAFDVASEVKAIDFARQNGARIINASYGGSSFSQAEYDAIQRFMDAGGIFIAASGNDSADIDSSPIYPAAYTFPGLISVAATDQSDALGSFSNYGDTSVDIGAPGVNILSTYVTGTSTPAYARAQGTSMAAPQVAGTVALIKSLYPSLSVASTTEAILVSGEATSTLSGKVATGKRLNAHRALQAAGGADFVAPIITLNGSANISLNVGDTYTELGATAIDNRDATTTVSIGGDVVTTSAAGTYHVTYDAADAAGNQATQVVRTVTVSTVSSGGGGGGGGGGSSSKKKKKTTTTKASTKSTNKSSVTKTINPPRPAVQQSVNTQLPSVAPSPLPAFVFARPLSIGMSGTDVTALQQLLTRQGLYTGPVTGYFGPLTATGVRSYQAKHLLPMVGQVGPMTLGKLNAGL